MALILVNLDPSRQFMVGAVGGGFSVQHSALDLKLNPCATFCIPAPRVDAVRIRKKDCRCSNVYLTININAFLNINTQVYIFKPAYLSVKTISS